MMLLLLIIEGKTHFKTANICTAVLVVWCLLLQLSYGFMSLQALWMYVLSCYL